MILVGAAPAGPAASALPTKPTVNRIIIFAADGMRPDLMERYAREGAMPTFAELLRRGGSGRERLGPGLPAQHRGGHGACPRSHRRMDTPGSRGCMPSPESTPGRPGWAPDRTTPEPRRARNRALGQSRYNGQPSATPWGRSGIRCTARGEPYVRHRRPPGPHRDGHIHRAGRIAQLQQGQRGTAPQPPEAMPGSTGCETS